ncbi:MAG: lactate utilization protein C [Actinomycetaceae bacterium]|nr:lactate utilization protein C [Actinomycetaceae bacterium]
MSAKDDILANLRASLACSQKSVPEQPHRDYRLEGEYEPGSPEVIDEFADALVDYKAKVWRVKASGIADAIDEALEGCGSAVVPAGLDAEWRQAASRSGRQVAVDAPESVLSHYELDGTDAVVTGSRVAISGTGSILLDGTPDQGRRALTLIPDTHVVVVFASVVQPTTPQALAIIGEHPTRPITWIAGPSATSDIELVRVDGVHGPRNLNVIIVEDR